MDTVSEQAQRAEQLRNAVGHHLRLDHLAAIPSAGMDTGHHVALTAEHDPSSGAVTVRAAVVVRFVPSAPAPLASPWDGLARLAAQTFAEHGE